MGCTESNNVILDELCIGYCKDDSHSDDESHSDDHEMTEKEEELCQIWCEENNENKQEIYSLSDLTMNDFSNRQNHERPICVYDKCLYATGKKTLESIILPNITFLFLPNNLNINLAFKDKYKYRAKKDIVTYCLKNRIYPINKSFNQFIRNLRSSNETEFYLKCMIDYKDGWIFKENIHTNIVINEFIPDNIQNKLIYHLYNPQYNRDVVIPHEIICKALKVNSDIVENYLIEELHRYFENDTVFKHQMMCGCNI